MALADEELGLTKLSKIGRYLKLTDEVVFDQLLSLSSKNQKTRLARKLADNYNERRLVKCVFERVMQRKDRVVEQIFSQKRFRTQLTSDIAETAGVDAASVYVDVPTTPSVPYTYAREELNSITLYSEGTGGRYTDDLSISDLPLVGSIRGFTDVLRIYTVAEHRSRVAEAVQTVFGRKDFTTRISI